MSLQYLMWRFRYKGRISASFIASDSQNILLVGNKGDRYENNEMRPLRTFHVREYRRFGYRTIANIDIEVPRHQWPQERLCFELLNGLPMDWLLAGARDVTPEEFTTALHMTVDKVTSNMATAEGNIIIRLIAYETWISTTLRHVRRNMWSVGIALFLSLVLAIAGLG